MKKFFLILCFLAVFHIIQAQTVIVNSDDTHSIVIDNGNTKTIVNPDGTHSTVIDNGNTKTIVKPDGTHSTIIDNGNTKTIVNPDGTHSTVIDNGQTKTIVNPDGTHSIVINNGNTKTIVNSNGSHSTVIYNHNLGSDERTINVKQQINKQAPFYSHKLPPESPKISKIYDSTKIEIYYPFIIYKDDSYMIAAEIENTDLFKKYNPIFKKYGYSGSGYSWEGHIKQILQKENPSLLRHLRFDSEAGGVYVFADSEKHQRQLAELIGKIFEDLTKLENYLKAADDNKTDNSFDRIK